MMNIDYSKNFKKQYKKLSKKRQAQFAQRLTLFVADPHAPSLHKHKLTNQAPDTWSINITGDLRALYQVQENSDVLFIAIGTHSELYR